MTLVELLRSLVGRLFGPPEPPEPGEQLKNLLERLHAELREAKIRAADMIRDEKKLAAERDRHRIEANAAEKSAKDSLEAGQDASVRRQIERKLHAQDIAEQLEQQRIAVATEVRDMKAAIETYQIEIDRVERERRTWEMRQRTAQLKNAMSNGAPSAALQEARQLLSESREAALREEARAEVRTRLSDADAQRDAHLRRRNLAVEREIARLKGDARKTPPE